MTEQVDNTQEFADAAAEVVVEETTAKKGDMTNMLRGQIKNLKAELAKKETVIAEITAIQQTIHNNSKKDLLRVLGWMDYFEKNHPGQATWFPAWLVDIEDFHRAIKDRHVELRSETYNPRTNQTIPVYVLSEQGRIILDKFVKETSGK